MATLTGSSILWLGGSDLELSVSISAIDSLFKGEPFRVTSRVSQPSNSHGSFFSFLPRDIGIFGLSSTVNFGTCAEARGCEEFEAHGLS